MFQFVSLSAYRPWFPGFDRRGLGTIIYENCLYSFTMTYATAWSTVLFVKLIVTHGVMKFIAFCAT